MATALRAAMFKAYADDLTTNSTFRHIQIGIGVVSLSIAALMTVHALARRRQQAHLLASAGATSSVALAPERPSGISRFLGGAPDEPKEDVSAIRRLLRRAQTAWENGSLWVAFVIGLLSGPAVDEVLCVLAIIVGSGAPMGTQVITAIAVVFGILAIVEITLVSYVISPAKTQAVLRRVHDWALAHRRKILIAMCTVAGTSMMVHGMTGI